jgi:hypothetical protein
MDNMRIGSESILIQTGDHIVAIARHLNLSGSDILSKINRFPARQSF